MVLNPASSHEGGKEDDSGQNRLLILHKRKREDPMQSDGLNESSRSPTLLSLIGGLEQAICPVLQPVPNVDNDATRNGVQGNPLLGRGHSIPCIA